MATTKSKVLAKELSLNTMMKVLPTKGNLVYEYNPLRNYRLTQNKYEYQEQFYTEQELEDTFDIIIDKTYKVVPNATIQNGKKVALENGTAINIPIIAFKNGSYRQHFKIEGRDPSNHPVTDECGNYLPNGTSAVAWVVRYNNRQYWEEEFLRNINSIFPQTGGTQWLKKTVVDGKEIYVPLTGNTPILHEIGELSDFITDELQFDLEHPVNITPQYSYDGSVNLIINDGINVPRLINSRFSATGKNTYEIIDRKGDNDTNIYDQGTQFDIDTSLFKRVCTIPKLEYKGTTSGGNLKIGNYHFYIKLSDADGNETDFVAESGLVSVFIGFSNPSSITTGVKNQNSYKGVSLYLSNIDLSYNYLYVYYSRYTAEQEENFNTEYKKIDKKFIISNSGTATVNITGFEPTFDVTDKDINMSYEIIDAAKTQEQCQNMLFLGNVHKQDIPYDKLQDLSLHFLPYLEEKDYICNIDENYIVSSTSQGYYNSEFIYKYTGYWNEELYRLGVVYILPNGQLTPVFNIRGNTNIQKYGEITYSQYNIPDKVVYNESNYLVVSKGNPKNIQNENVKGVVRLKSNRDTNVIHGFDIRISKEAIQELKKYATGFFFVRQSRIPTILAQGVTMGVDQEAHVPCIATADGILTELGSNLNTTHV